MYLLIVLTQISNENLWHLSLICTLWFAEVRTKKVFELVKDSGATWDNLKKLSQHCCIHLQEVNHFHLAHE